jgi:nicotinate-nucleotide--dimethylbenzimidazole phosphoribosyltransferase
MDDLLAVCAQIDPVDESWAVETQRLLDAKTKPRRSLGRLEDLACQIAAIRRTPTPEVGDKAIVVMAADHGVATAGVSAYPQEVTGQMVLNFARGGAAINVLARHAGVRLVVVDMGIREPVEADGVLQRRLGPGTADFRRRAAMTREQAEEGLVSGIAIARELVDEGISLIGIGEMGIGNTTSSSALISAFTGTPPKEVTGTGTGVDEETRGRKIEAIRHAIEHNRPDPADAIDVMAKLGGFEIAGLAGVVLGAASRHIPVLADGFIASVAALVAVRLAPAAKGYVIASHRSTEPGHQAVLVALGARPVLDLELRLGEGTGAALAMPLIDAALRILAEMASFEDAGVTDTGH